MIAWYKEWKSLWYKLSLGNQPFNAQRAILKMFYKIRGISAKSGKGTVSVVYRQADFETVKATGVSVAPKDFETKTGKVKSRVPEHPEQNAKIQAVANDIETAVRNLNANGEALTKATLDAEFTRILKFNEAIQGAGEVFPDYLTQQQQEIEALAAEVERRKENLVKQQELMSGYGVYTMPTKPQREARFTDKITAFLKANPNQYSPATLRGYNDLISILTKFKRGLLVKDIDLPLIQSLQTYLLGKKMRNQSVRVILTRFKTVFKIVAEELNLPTAFLGKLTMVKELANDNVIFLNVEEIEAIEQIPLSGSMQRQVRAQFLFACETGLRHSDLCITQANITGDTLTVVMQKSKRTVKPPLTAKAREILNGPEFPFKFIHVNHYSKCLKTICEKIPALQGEVTLTHFVGNKATSETKPKWQLVSSHVARKTAINNWLKLGVRETVVALWAGHKNTKMIQKHYQNQDEASANEAMKLLK